jgi:hypothetical protein
MNKYKAGGRCGGSGNGAPHAGELPLAALLAARDAQDAAWARPAQAQTQLAIVKPAPEKKNDIDFIMSGDYTS